MTYPNYPTDRLVNKTVRKLNGEGVYTGVHRKKSTFVRKIFKPDTIDVYVNVKSE